MKTRTKVLGLMMAAVLLVSATIFGTMAYLTSTDEVTNTFTVGNVAITLDEAKVDATTGKKITGEGAARVKENSYKLLPGHEYDKDPTVHVAADSEECWLFVKVENGISAIEDSSNTIASQLEANNWTPVAEGSNVYCRETTNKAGDNQVVFEHFTISGNVDNNTLAGFATTYEEGNKTPATNFITVTAYAVQRDGFDNAKAAWDAAQFN